MVETVERSICKTNGNAVLAEETADEATSERRMETAMVVKEKGERGKMVKRGPVGLCLCVSAPSHVTFHVTVCTVTSPLTS
eukprot:3304916-Rhodomonas_salina.1